MTDRDAYYNFYEKADRDQVYNTRGSRLEREQEILRHFVAEYHPQHGHILEIGSGRGGFQDITENYTGVDIAESLRRYYGKGKQYVVVKDGESYPFPTHSFESALTFATFEHIPSIEFALDDFVRVMRPGGHILFHAAWQVRPWTSKIYLLRPYSELGFKHRFEKFSTIIRETMVWRSIFVFPKRIMRTLQYLNWKRKKDGPWRLDYKKLDPYYESFVQDDCDACNHIDIHAVILWFMSRQCEIVGHYTLDRGRTGSGGSLWKTLFLRTGCFVVKLPQ